MYYYHIKSESSAECIRKEYDLELMLSLRGHHLICLHFFNGEGYDKTFIKNLGNVLSRAENEDITISSGADDVCNSCLYLNHGRCEHSENADEDIREMDKRAMALLNLSGAGRVRWALLHDSVREIFPEWHSLYCTECNWRGACEKNDFFQELLKDNNLHASHCLSLESHKSHKKNRCDK